MAPKHSGKKLATAVAAAALLWGEAASAAVTPLPARIDPLVALSALGTAGSQGAVCGSGAAAAAAATAAAQGAPGSCVLPVSDVTPPPPAPGAVPPPPPPAIGASIIIPLVVIAAWLAALVAIKSSGYAVPASPA